MPDSVPTVTYHERSLAAAPPSIAIIGGGFTGAVTAIKLLDAAIDPLAITVIEPRTELGRGLAYSTSEPGHVMNGPAKLFSLYPERPDHFARFLARHGREWGWRDPQTPDYASAYAPRRVYGDYVRAELSRAAAHAPSGVTLRHVVAEAHDLRPDHRGVAVTLQDGTELRADQAVLALGVLQARPEIAIHPAVRGSPRYIEDPWDTDRFETLPRTGRVLLMGSGLTMLDAVISLERRGFRGEYLAVSRRGLSVQPRREPPPLRDFLAENPLPRRLIDLLRTARTELARVSDTRPDWQALVMAIRPHVAPLWQRASHDERQRFLRHLRPIWDISLHRAPPHSIQLLERGRREGWFVQRAGRLRALHPAADGRVGAEVTWRGADQSETIPADIVINCTGAQHVWARCDDRPLVRNLLSRGLVRPGPHGIGIDADTGASLIGRDGRRSETLTAVGPPLRGVQWESNAITEILQQAIVLAPRLIDRLHAPRSASTGAPVGPALVLD